VLPDNVGFRLKQGSGILLNIHFINALSDSLDGQAVLDVKFADAVPTRKVASLRTNATLSFDIPPQAGATGDAVCAVPRDFDFIMYGNHMHAYGTSIITTIERANGSSEVIHEDPTWTRDMEFNAPLDQWPGTAPFHVGAGDTLHTHCIWQNPTPGALAFPSEMCIGFGFFLGDGSSSPICIDGAWTE